MGASGAGKTTLFNILSGMVTPTAGKVTVNSVDLHAQPEQLEGVIGYVPQDDLLIEELTIFENLYFNAKLCFKDMDEVQLRKRVLKVLIALDLIAVKHLRVGSPLEIGRAHV